MKEVEKIIQYLDGDLNADERKRFELELESNPLLAQHVMLTQQVDRLIADNELLSFIENLKLAREQYKSEELLEQNKAFAESTEKLKRNLSLSRKILAAASVVIAISISAIVYSLFSTPSNDRIFSQFYQKYEADIITRSSGISDGNALISAIQLYDKGNYKEAIRKFNEILKTDKDNTTAHFFIGASYIETAEYEKAINNLSFVIAQNDTAFVEHAEWYLALCYVKTNQTAKANALLTKIAGRQTFYKLMAMDVLKKLK